MHTRKRDNRVCIIGVGNLLRQDEGFGVWVAQWLAQERLPSGIEVVDGGTGGLDLLPYFDHARKIILVDVAETGATPGTLYRLGFSPEAGCCSLMGCIVTAITDLSACPQAENLKDRDVLKGFRREDTPKHQKTEWRHTPLTQKPFSLHQLRLLEVLELALLLGYRAEVVILAAQPRLLGWGVGLSPELETCVPKVSQLALQEGTQG